LRAAIRSVLEQDYPDFELFIVVDSVHDPAWEIAHEAVRESGATNVHISPLQSRGPRCSLLAGSLAQFLGELDDSCQYIGFAVANLSLPKDFLRHMAAALSDESVGATLAHRWYALVGGNWGTLLRYLWNAGAVVPMWVCRMAWAPGLAMRRTTALQIGLREYLLCGMSEDSPVKAALDQLGLKGRFVPQLVLMDREETTLLAACDYIFRQLYWVKLYNSQWWLIVLTAASNTLVMFAPLLLSAVMLAGGHWTAALIAGFAGIFHLAVLLGLLAMIESSIRSAIAGRMEPLPSLSLRTAFRAVPAVLLAQLVHLFSVLRAVVQRKVWWRGVRYQIDGPWNVQIIEDSRMPSLESVKAVGGSDTKS
jgi:glycosyltransferase involved in cell wall biosynthesis